MPRIVHQIWLGGDAPPEYQPLQETYRRLTQRGWQYRAWDDVAGSELIDAHYPELASVWYGLEQPVKRADLLRYLVMHRFGGLYADVDSWLKGDMDEFLATDHIIRDDFSSAMWPISPRMGLSDDRFDIVVGAENTIWDHLYNSHGLAVRKINNAVLFSRPALDFWLNLVRFSIGRADQPVLNAFGVHTFTYFIYHTLVDAWPQCEKFKHAPRILVLPAAYFHLTSESDDARQLIVHRYDGTWREQ